MVIPTIRSRFKEVPGLYNQLLEIVEAMKNLNRDNFRPNPNMTGVDLTTSALTVTSLTIGGNTIGQGEFENLDGLDQSVGTTDDVTFNDVTITTPVNIYLLSHDSFADFVANEHIDWTNATVALLTTNTIGGSNITGSGLVKGATGHFGGASHYSDFEADGTLHFTGDATVWDDYVTPLTKANFGGAANDPTQTKLFDDGSGSAGIWGLVFGVGDEVVVTVQMPHSWKLGTTIYPHIHWMAMTDVDPTDNFAIEFEYIWTSIDADFPATSTLATIDNIPTGVNSQYQHQLTNLPAAGLSGAGKGLSSVLMCRIKRVAATTDNYAGGIAILDFDVHYEKDTIGSRQIATK